MGASVFELFEEKLHRCWLGQFLFPALLEDCDTSQVEIKLR
jgi:hypothetical protein